ncbi:MAG: hypothetical protein ACLRPW_04415 [Intestinibacter sp.]
MLLCDKNIQWNDDEAINKVMNQMTNSYSFRQPEVLYNGLYNKFIYNNFTSKSSIIIPDGIGVVKP